MRCYVLGCVKVQPEIPEQSFGDVACKSRNWIAQHFILLAEDECLILGGWFRFHASGNRKFVIGKGEESSLMKGKY